MAKKLYDKSMDDTDPMSAYDLRSEIVVETLLRCAGGMLAILDDDQRAVALNDSAVQYLDAPDPTELLGLRLGQIVRCTNSLDHKQGCGHHENCVSCHARMAMVASQEEKRPQSARCAINTNINGENRDLYFQLRSAPFESNGRQYLALYFQDVTSQQRWENLDRTFFHDINNLLMAVMAGASELVTESNETSKPLAVQVQKGLQRVAAEVAIQQQMGRNRSHSYSPLRGTFSAKEIIELVRLGMDHHPATAGKRFEIDNDLESDVNVYTDQILACRVLTNMLINAFEASAPNTRVRLGCNKEPKGVRFWVWNTEMIPTSIQGRIFQRNFSTKASIGRGLGTFAMKLLGEDLLGGHVYFTSSKSAGTRFTLLLPES